MAMAVGRGVCAALHLVAEQELAPATERAFDVTAPCRLGERGEPPDQPGVAPGARAFVVDRARRVELLRIAHQPLDERLEAWIGPETRQRYVPDNATSET